MQYLRFVFERRLFLVFLVPFCWLVLLSIMFGGFQAQGINKTIGWAWSIEPVFLALFSTVLSLVYGAVYGIFAFLKIKTSLMFSIGHCVFFFMPNIFGFQYTPVIAIIAIISFLFFLLNMTVSIVKAKKLKQNRP